jgi:hypothetical protein
MERAVQLNMMVAVARRAMVGWLLVAGGAGAQEKVEEGVKEEGFPSVLVEWKNEPAGAVFQGLGGGGWDAKIRERGWIRPEGSAFRLWYTGYDVEGSPTRFLGLASSKDGILWERHGKGPLTRETWVEDVCVVEEGGLFHLFAEGRGDIPHRMTSRDGVEWEVAGPLDIRKVDGEPISPGPFGTPAVWVEGGVWYLFYERGDRGVWLATSRDLAVWTNVRDEPVLDMGPEAYDRTAVAINQIVKISGFYYAIYHANDQMPWKDWSTCLARSADLVHWEKFPGNPIVRENSSSGMLVEGDGGRMLLYTMHPEVRRFVPAVGGGGRDKD